MLDSIFDDLENPSVQMVECVKSAIWKEAIEKPMGLDLESMAKAAIGAVYRCFVSRLGTVNSNRPADVTGPDSPNGVPIKRGPRLVRD